MATLALSVVGAGIGSYTGIGASAGWMAGATMGRFLFPDAQSSGSALNDLKFSGASYGAIIPTLFGTMRLSGNIIWAGDLQKESTASQTSGKGGAGGARTQTGLSYSASFAIAFASGEVDSLIKIWADGTLIFDAQSAGDKRRPDLRFRFYSGDETQTPDSIMEAELGAGNVPAYRGVCYLVFDTLPLTDYGNRLPNIEVLITKKAIPNYPQKTGLSYAFVPDQLVQDQFRNVAYSYEVMGGVNVVRKIDMRQLAVVQEAEIGPVFPELPNASAGLCLDRNGDLWLGTGYGLLPGRKIHRFNTAIMGLEASKSLPSGVGVVTYSVDIQDPLSGSRLQVAGSQQSAQVVVFDPNLDVVEYFSTTSPACSGVLRDDFENAWVIMSGLAAVDPFADLEIIRVSMSASPSEEGLNFQEAVETYIIPAAELSAGGAGLGNCITRPAAYMKQQQEIVFLNDHRLLKFSMVTGQVTAVRDSAVAGYTILENSSDGDTIVFTESSRWLVYVSAHTLEEVERIDLQLFANVGSFVIGAYDAETDSLLLLTKNKPLQRLYLRRRSGDGALFSETIHFLTDAAGLSAEDVDVSQLSGEIGGYALTRPMTVQDAMEPLFHAGHFNLTESGYSLKFNSLDQMSVRDIPLEDLMQPLTQGRIQESELPGSVALSYMAMDAGYQIGTQTAKRSYSPHATMYGRNEMSMTLPMALSANFAKSVCYQSLYDAWSERMVQNIRLPLKYLALDAADIITLVDGDKTHRGRIAQTYLTPDLSLDIEAVGSTELTASFDINADDGRGFIEARVSVPAFSEMFLLDIPLLRDADATAGSASRYYYGLSGYGESWKGAGLFTSSAGERYEQTGYSETGVGWGVAATALSDVLSPWQTDRKNMLVVQFVSGAARLENVTELDMLNGANTLLVGTEIIQFSNIELRDDGRYELSNLLRGRRGTEGATSQHKIGERVVLLEEDRLFGAVAALSFLNTPHYWKAVSAGQLLEDVPAAQHRLTGTDLRPYAPVHVVVARDVGSISFSWVRRTRVGGGSLAGPVPLSETSERYELEVEYMGKKVSKYISDVRNFIYLLDDFNLDFEAVATEIPALNFRVFQLSEAIGRGTPAEEVI